MKRFAFLILLLLWGQFDDGLAVALTVPADSLAYDDDGDDEYPQSQRESQKEESLPKPASFSLKPQVVVLPPAQTSVPSECGLTTPLSPPPLYVYMSLQI
jgi:hypothetical protein